MYLVDGSRPPKPDEWEDIIWYPGLAAVEARKQDYIRSHPQIRAHSGPFLPDDHNLEELDSDPGFDDGLQQSPVAFKQGDEVR